MITRYRNWRERRYCKSIGWHGKRVDNGLCRACGLSVKP